MAWVLRSLSSSTHLHQLVHVPFIFNEEILIIKQEIPEDHISMSFDGTTHAAEAFVVVQHFADGEWCVKQRVGGLMLLAKSLSSEEVSCLLVETSFKQLGII